MAMVIATNTSAMNANKAYNRSSESVGSTMRRLSSGLRINSAKDDAAGLAISEKMTTQIRGLSVGTRNISDGVSMLQTAEGALEEVSNMLQRIRELSVQAANTGVVSADDRKKLQLEVNQLVTEIDRIAKNTEFNGVKILNDHAITGPMGGDSKIVDAMKRSWLEVSSSTVEKYYGLSIANAKLTVDIYSGEVGGTLASAGGSAGNLVMNIDRLDFEDASYKNGGSGWLYQDRIVTHEMVHAATANEVSVALDSWFKEGTSELIHGADERVAGHGLAATMAVGNSIDTGATALSGSIQYAKAYLAARYIHAKAGGYDPENPTGSGMGRVFDLLKNGSSLLDAINEATGETYANITAFHTDFDTNGQAYLEANGLDLNNSDTGAIAGADAEGGQSYRSTTAETTVYDINNFEENPTDANVVFNQTAQYASSGFSQQMTFQVGANEGQVLRTGLVSASAKSLGIDDLDLVNYSGVVIGDVDTALDFVNQQRARLGAQMNRLESSIRNNETSIENASAARSRIKDADYAIETAQLTRSLILSQAATAMTAQAQATPQLALQLLQ
ncbi:MAG: flagellinolysin [Gammaproteobacteria bacterium]|nr:flagellinolysin [Gammaproteobacteria bacterium]